MIQISTSKILNKKKQQRVSNRDVNAFSKFWDTLLTIIVGLFAFACVFPFLFVVIISFTNEKSLAKYGYRLIPKKWSLSAYDYVLNSSDSLIKAYGVTIFITVVGTILSLTIMSLYAYAISRKGFKFRKFFTFYAFFTMLFGGGLVPTYLVVSRLLSLKNTVWALILPMACGAWNILILKTFFRTSVPDAIIESAKIDGASEIRTFVQMVLPISLPAMATIGLFCTLGYWNDWFNALLYIDNQNLMPLQYLLMKIQNSMDFLTSNVTRMNSADSVKAVAQLPKNTARMAMVVLATGPIVLAYPFFQKYFVQGLTIGAVKE